MNKDIYLEQLYKELQLYNTDSVIKHVTEYDYIISDMLEESTIEEVIEKLGTAPLLASSIAEEFGYELKKTNQFEDSILNRKVNNKEKYATTTNYAPVAKVINVLFVIASVLFFISYFVSVIGLFIFITLFGIVSIPAMVWSMLALLAFSIFIFALYQLVRNLKNLLVNKLTGNPSEVN